MAVTVPKAPIVYRGNKEIAAACGVPFKEINGLVTRHGLPAFKINGVGTWLAFPDELEQWLRKKREEQRKK